MRVTSIGHAGFFIETKHGSILTDPWFSPAYFASWFPFPSNEHIDPKTISNPNYLYISHMHHDHMDPEFLRSHVSKDAVVLLPDYPLDLLERELRAIGFRHFVHTKNYEPMELDGLRIMIAAAVAPTDGPLGDSALMVDDGEARILDQNDSRPLELERLALAQQRHVTVGEASRALQSLHYRRLLGWIEQELHAGNDAATLHEHLAA